MQPPTNYRYRTSADSAKRFSDAIGLHQTVLGRDGILARRYLAVGLSTGESDGPYDNREEAWRHNQNKPERMFVFPIPLERIGPPTADVILWYVRQCYDNGWREDGRYSLWLPDKVEDLRRQQ